MRRLGPGAVAGLLVLAACSSGGGDGGAPALSTTDTADASPTSDPVTTEVTVTTEAAPTTEVTPTSTTIDPLVDPDGVDPLPPLDESVALPIVFVHGFAGSAQQYESQKMRFVANGYPSDRIVAFEHDGAGLEIDAYAAGLVEVVDDALASFDAPQVYLVGHSRGTAVSGTYLGDPAQAAKVAKYVAIDGAPCPDATIVDCIAPNQDMFPGQAHVETATSKESFAAQYEFLVGTAPDVVDIVAQREPVMISGRAVNFPANTGREGVTLDIWHLDADTGHRTDDAPHATFQLDAAGEFGPVAIESGEHYEYSLTTPDSSSEHHLYLQPYVRDSDFVRLLSSPPDGTTRMNTNTSEGHSAIIAMRMREWYPVDDPDLDGDQRDVLEVSTDGGAAVNVLTEFVGNGAIGIHAHDDLATPAATTLEALPYFSEQPFQSGVDVYMPSSPDGAGTITVTNVPRGDVEASQTLNTPNWPSTAHAISVVFADYPVD